MSRHNVYFLQEIRKISIFPQRNLRWKVDWPFSSLRTKNKIWYFHKQYFQKIKSNTVKPVLVVTSIKQPTCIKQPEESCPKIHRLIYLKCIKQPPAFSSHILSFPWVAASDRFDCISITLGLSFRSIQSLDSSLDSSIKILCWRNGTKLTNQAWYIHSCGQGTFGNLLEWNRCVSFATENRIKEQWNILN